MKRIITLLIVLVMASSVAFVYADSIDTDGTEIMAEETAEVIDGVVKIDGKIYYYHNGKPKKNIYLNLLKQGSEYISLEGNNTAGKVYFFDDEGVGKKNSILQKVKIYYNGKKSEKKYLINEKGKFVSGTFIHDNKRYYYRDGLPVNGKFWKNNYLYWCTSTGRLHCSQLKKINGDRFYFDYKGRGSNVDLVSDGKVVGIKLRIPCISQLPELPVGCEVTALYMAAKNLGCPLSKVDFAKEMPLNKNPDLGFSGTPFKLMANVKNRVHPSGLKKLIKKYCGGYNNIKGKSLSPIKKSLNKGKPVLVWLRKVNGFNYHTVLVTGYDKNYIYLNNPYTARREKATLKLFKKKMAGMALSY